MSLLTKKEVSTAAASVLVLALFAGPGLAQAAPCSNATLKGDYGFTITGQILGGPSAGLVAGVAMTSFDGDGNLTQVDHVVHNGVPPALDWRPAAASSSYNVNADCTGTMEIDFTDGSPSLHVFIVVDRMGREIRAVVNNPGTAITSIGIKEDSPL